MMPYPGTTLSSANNKILLQYRNNKSEIANPGKIAIVDSKKYQNSGTS